MPEYDAFGREVGENTLEGLGGDSRPSESEWTAEQLAEARAAEAAAEAQEGMTSAADTPPGAMPPELTPQGFTPSNIMPPAATPPGVTPPAYTPPGFTPPGYTPPASTPPGATPPAATPPTFATRPTTIHVGRGARRGLGCVATIVVLSVLVAIGGAVVAGIVGLNAAEEAITNRPEIALPTLPGAPAADAPRGLEPTSLVRRGNFARALRRVRAEKLGKLRSIRVAPERIDVQILTPEGRLLSAQLRHDGEFQRFGASGPGFGFVDTVPYGRVNTAAPERLTRAGARRLGRGAKSLDYLAYVAGTGEIAWGAFFKGGGHVQGDRAGRFLRRVS